MSLSSLRWRSSSRSDVGKVRRINEDACLDWPEAGLWAVADGMGGHAAGDVASRMIVEALHRQAPGDRLSDAVESIERDLLQVNTRLREIAAHNDTHTIGSTVAVLVARGRHAVCLWAGDSRVYRYREGRLDQISQDHAPVEELVEKGLLTRQQAATHPLGNLVSRAVGAADRLVVDLEIVEIEPGDRFVLCSDGLDKEVEPEEIAQVLSSERREAGRLVELALSRGSRDNVTVVVVEFSASAAPPVGEGEDDEDTVPDLAGSG